MVFAALFYARVMKIPLGTSAHVCLYADNLTTSLTLSLFF